MHFSVLVVALSSLVIYAAVAAASRRPKVPEGLPWLAKRSNVWFAERKAALKISSNIREELAEASAKFLKKGKSYILPNLFSKPDIVIPIEQFRWLLDHPDSKSSVGAAHYDQLAGDYAFTSPELLRTLYHEHVVHRNLPRRLASLIPGTWDEIAYTIDKTWGRDSSEWREIRVQENMTSIISSVSNRMFVGLPLCRNQDFLQTVAKFANTIITIVIVLGITPEIFKPIVGRVLALKNHFYFHKIKGHVLPLIKQRVIDMDYNEQHPDVPRPIPEDYFTWHLREARLENRVREQDPELVARYVMPIEFAAIHTTTLTVVNTILDLLGSDPAKKYLEGIREEIQRVYDEEGGVWSKVSLGKLYRTDSAIRESMRCSAFATVSLHRKVVAKEGITNVAEGWTAPQGAAIAVDAWTRQHDPDVYPDPHTYDAFRFSRPREEFEAGRNPQGDSNEYLKVRNLSMTTTGDTFLPFGHGKHACPGRFFVNHELKMLFAYILLNYEVQYLPQRPPNIWLGRSNFPPASATIKVRRRDGS